MEIKYPDNLLLSFMNRYEYPDVKAHCYVVQGRHGELYVTARPGEALDKWAGTNGYDKFGDFLDDLGDQIEWSNGGKDGFLDEGGSLKTVEIIGYYRDGVDHL